MQAPEHQASRLTAILPNLRRYARALVGEQKHADELVRDTLKQACCLSAATPCGRDPKYCLLGILNRHYQATVRRKASPHRDAHRNPVDVALQSLPLEQRAILLLNVLERMSIKQIADVVDRPPAWVTTSLTFSREILRTQLDTADFASLP